jgi:hypothetical protein
VVGGGGGGAGCAADTTVPASKPANSTGEALPMYVIAVFIEPLLL